MEPTGIEPVTFPALSRLRGALELTPTAEVVQRSGFGTQCRNVRTSQNAGIFRQQSSAHDAESRKKIPANKRISGPPSSIPRDPLQAGGHRFDPGWLHKYLQIGHIL